ncbi:hypothetical protein [Stenotrophomonas sp.]|uniref:hypothetical protein n=1 Tax=Stenotrophomonas sp. TaxID=69392 RepID=UPI0028AF7A1B|nr:hypothetical protein [Stenotrophomonas sp.]
MIIRYMMAIVSALALTFSAAAADTLTKYQCSLVDKDGNFIRPPGNPFPVTYMVWSRDEEEAKSKTLELAKQDGKSAPGAKCFGPSPMK